MSAENTVDELHQTRQMQAYLRVMNDEHGLWAVLPDRRGKNDVDVWVCLNVIEKNIYDVYEQFVGETMLKAVKAAYDSDRWR